MLVGECGAGWPRGWETAARLEQGFAELFEVEPPPHAFAAELRVGVVVAEAARLDERDDGLYEKAPGAALAVADGEPRFSRPKPSVVVHAEEKRGIDGRTLDGLAQNCGRARLRE